MDSIKTDKAGSSRERLRQKEAQLSLQLVLQRIGGTLSTAILQLQCFPRIYVTLASSVRTLLKPWVVTPPGATMEGSENIW